ncbi:hypothetical protein [Sinomonas susongensis]|uniref:hypothetical protein n=1 Tax=Sinomonas susongensis TaxID=1324851 RepID=UPI00110934B0|nr:hypothetical protein [Sinomonas susongensis]
MQGARFEHAAAELYAAYFDASMRADLEGHKEPLLAQRWRDSLDDQPPFDPQRPFRVPTVALSMQVAAEHQFLFVALRNALRAHDRLPAGLKPAVPGGKAITLLRNVMEHWDEEGGSSISELVETEYHRRAMDDAILIARLSSPDEEESARRRYNDEPMALHASFSVSKHQVTVGGFTVEELQEWLESLDAALRAALAEAGFDAPWLEDSIVARDDNVAWPANRFRGRQWQIPQVEIEEWAARPSAPQCDVPFEGLRQDG